MYTECCYSKNWLESTRMMQYPTGGNGPEAKQLRPEENFQRGTGEATSWGKENTLLDSSAVSILKGGVFLGTWTLKYCLGFKFYLASSYQRNLSIAVTLSLGLEEPRERLTMFGHILVVTAGIRRAAPVIRWVEAREAAKHGLFKAAATAKTSWHQMSGLGMWGHSVRNWLWMVVEELRGN